MQNIVKLLFFMAVWKRPEITEICFMGLKRLKKSGVPMEFFAVISEPSMIDLCEKYGVGWCMTTNNPLGAKKNFGLSQAMKKDFDYMIEIGSDDLLKNEFLSLYDYDRDVMALSDFVMLNTANGECQRLTRHHAYFGAGRAISRKALESLNAHGVYSLWTDSLNRGLDNQSTFFLARRGYMEKRVSSEKPLMVGLKSEVNIWPYDNTVGAEYSLDDALNGLSEEEINAIKALHVTVTA